MVNKYWKIEFVRLKYLRRNQTALRASGYTSICKQLGDPQCTENEVDILCTRRVFELSSIYFGNVCYMRQNNHNIIEISNKKGYLDMVFTMKCNP